MKKLKYVIGVIIIIGLVIAGIYFISTLAIREKEKIKLYIYQDKENISSIDVTEYKLTKEELEDSNVRQVGVYRAKSNNVKYYSYESKYITLKDNNEYYLFNYVSGISKQLFIEGEEIDDIQIISNDSEAIGVIVNVKGKNYTSKYYSLSNNKYLYDFDYWSPERVGNNMYISYSKPNKENNNTYIEIGVFNANTDGKKVMQINLNNTEYEESYALIPLTEENYDIKYWVLANVSGEAVKVYNNQGKLVLDNIECMKYGVGNNNIILCLNDNKYFNVYNSNGELIRKSTKYDEVYKILNKFVLVVDNNNLNLIDSNENIVKNIIKWDSSRYTLYTGNIEYKEESGRPYEIYITIVDSNIEIGKEGCALEYCYNIDTKELSMKKLTEF